MGVCYKSHSLLLRLRNQALIQGGEQRLSVMSAESLCLFTSLYLRKSTS